MAETLVEMSVAWMALRMAGPWVALKGMSKVKLRDWMKAEMLGDKKERRTGTWWETTSVTELGLPMEIWRAHALAALMVL